jgi:hypothetical protein
MAARRHSDATLTILLMGLGSIGLFGGVVVHYSRQTPILRLRPALEQQYGQTGFETRFIAGPAPWIEVVPPEGLAFADEWARTDLGVWALSTYRELTEQQTGVTECRLLLRDGTIVAVDTEMVSMLEAARSARDLQLELLRRAGVEQPEVVVLGVVRSGVHVSARGRGGSGAGGEELQRLARKAATALSALSYVSRARVEVLGPGEARASAEAGRDVPRVPLRKPPRAPGQPAPPAPIDTRLPGG